MPLYGYAHASPFDQTLSVQRAALKSTGYKLICAEAASNTRRDTSTDLQVVLDNSEPGAALAVTRIDGLARSALPGHQP